MFIVKALNDLFYNKTFDISVSILKLSFSSRCFRVALRCNNLSEK